MDNFYKFTDSAKPEEADLYINGDIIENNDAWLYEWFDIEATAPKAFRNALASNKGKRLNIYINSYGGSTIAASAIYTMLLEHEGGITVKIPSIAASAASVIAMAACREGDRIEMSDTAMLMIHNPSTVARGDHFEMKKAENILRAVKDTIINAYERKTGLSREKLSAMMDSEKWMTVAEAMELGFADGKLGYDEPLPADVLNSIKDTSFKVLNLIRKPEPVTAQEPAAKTAEPTGPDEETLVKMKHAKARLDFHNLVRR